MFLGVPPSRLRLVTTILVVVAAASMGSTLVGISSVSSSSVGTGSAAHAYSMDAKVAVASSGSGIAMGAVNNGAAPDGGSGPTLGVLATIPLPVGSRPDGVAADTANGNVYVTGSQSDNVSVISGSTQQVIATIPVGYNPSGVVFDSGNSEVYVANFLGGDVKVINTTTNTVVATIPISGGPVGLAYDSTHGNVYATDQYANLTSVISGSTNAVIAKVGVGVDPVAAAFDASTGDVYVANALSSNVSVIDTSTNTVSATISVGSEPLGVAYDSGSGDIYVTNWLSNNTTVISGVTEKVVTSVTVDAHPVGIAYNTALSVIAVVADSASKVNFISNSTNARVANVTVGSLPLGIAYDPINGDEYVTNANSSNVSVIGTPVPPPYAVTFSESGLPAGTNWYVTLKGGSHYSTNGSIVFSETNGSYSFTVGAIAGYTASPPSGTVTVDGFAVPVPVTFSPVVYGVTFYESGLPSGTLWSVTFNGTAGATTNSTLKFSAKNGTFPFVVASIPGFSAGPSFGNETVAGSAVSIAITFTPVGIKTYIVTFSETGLPSGMLWLVTLNGTPESSTLRSLNFTEPNGAYPYTVGTVPGYNETPSSGTVTVNAGPTGVSVSFTKGPITPASKGSSIPLWEYAIVVAVIAAAVIAAVLLLRRRRPPAPSAASPQATETPETSA